MKTEIELNKNYQKLISEAEDYAHSLEMVKIANNVEYKTAGEYLIGIKTRISMLDEERKSATRPIDEAKKKIMDWFRKPIETLQARENLIKKAMLTFQQEQERTRREEEARLADLQRKEAERLAKKAAEADAKGKTEEAEELRQQAQEKQAITPVVPKTVEKINGIKTMTVWKYRVISLSIVPREYLCLDEKKVGAVARATRGTLVIPGIEIYSEETMAV